MYLRKNVSCSSVLDLAWSKFDNLIFVCANFALLSIEYSRAESLL